MGRNPIEILEARLTLTTEALRKSEERALAGQLALELMHEIRNPLDALGNLAYLTLQDADRSDLVRDRMALALEQMSMIREIADHTLGFVQASKTPRSIKVSQLAESALRIHQPTIDLKKICLVKDFPTDVTAALHANEILQVVSNLILNAVDAISPEGTLRVRVRRRGDSIDIVVSDSGHGIEPEHRQKIFLPFFTTKDGKGTGLGLALSARIIESHHGRLRMRTSTSPSRRGTTFKLSLPALTTEALVSETLMQRHTHTRLHKNDGGYEQNGTARQRVEE